MNEDSGGGSDIGVTVIVFAPSQYYLTFIN
jgi:hypothetical protein